ncbi:RraA family protein [Jannaschia sp. Os4]|uniref:RraA family protein n=1 Tax=Jannaschia sp. Os4 TaxID=2807617 RepID=UPI001939320C|nr:RraA family protein [Jannaschia sp. Os4]MBM2578045.1 RraA family protein [Jannaschia sp. Os4]
MDTSLLDLLRSVDTPTVCNAIEVAQGRRGFDAFTRGTPVASEPGAAMVGYARTARIRGTTAPTEPKDEIRARRMAYFEHMAAGPRPAVAVIEDEDDAPLGAWWGEVHVAVHLGLGMAGALTNGLVRDLGDLDPGFPVLAGGVGPSHGFVHVTGIGTGATVMGLRVEDGDLVHADRHGAVVVPPGVLPDLGEAIATLHRSEALILGPAREAGFDIERLRTAWAAFEAART